MLIQTKICNQDKRMETGIGKCGMLIMKKGKSETMKRNNSIISVMHHNACLEKKLPGKTGSGYYQREMNENVRKVKNKKNF